MFSLGAPDLLVWQSWGFARHWLSVIPCGVGRVLFLSYSKAGTGSRRLFP